MKLKLMTKVLVLLFLIVLFGNRSVACSCDPYPHPSIAFQNASAVFMGIVDTITIDTTIYGTLRKKVTFTIDKSWKGAVGHTIVVYTATLNSLCGYSFEKGKVYLVYCNGVNELSASLCSRTRRDNEASEDLSYLTTLDVKNNSLGTVIPNELLLLQNYPNPANPSTIFRFDIPQSTNVVLHLFNSLGQNISEIFSGFVQKGRREINWNSSHIPSGIYVVRLQTPYGTKTIKTLLIK